MGLISDSIRREWRKEDEKERILRAQALDQIARGDVPGFQASEEHYKKELGLELEPEVKANMMAVGLQGLLRKVREGETPHPGSVATESRDLTPREFHEQRGDIGAVERPVTRYTYAAQPSKDQQYAQAAMMFAENQAVGMSLQQNIHSIAQRTGSLPPQFLAFLPYGKEQKDSLVAGGAHSLMKDTEFQQTTLQELVKEGVIESMNFNKLSPKDRELVKREIRDRAMLKASAALGHISPEWAKYLSGGGRVAAEIAGQKVIQEELAKEAVTAQIWGAETPTGRPMGPIERFKAKEEAKTPVVGLEQVKGRAILKTYVGTMKTIRKMIDFGKRTTPSKPGEFLWKIKDNFTNLESGERRRFRNIVARLPGLMYAMRGKQLSDKELEVALDMMPQMGFSDEAFIEAFVAFEEYMNETEAAWTTELREAGYREPRRERYAPGSADEAQLHQKLRSHGIDVDVINITE